jgi:hypothetical protein
MQKIRILEVFEKDNQLFLKRWKKVEELDLRSKIKGNCIFKCTNPQLNTRIEPAYWQCTARILVDSRGKKIDKYNFDYKEYMIKWVRLVVPRDTTSDNLLNKEFFYYSKGEAAFPLPLNSYALKQDGVKNAWDEFKKNYI